MGDATINGTSRAGDRAGWKWASWGCRWGSLHRWRCLTGGEPWCATVTCPHAGAMTRSCACWSLSASPLTGRDQVTGRHQRRAARAHAVLARRAAGLRRPGPRAQTAPGGGRWRHGVLVGPGAGPSRNRATNGGTSSTERDGEMRITVRRNSHARRRAAGDAVSAFPDRAGKTDFAAQADHKQALGGRQEPCAGIGQGSGSQCRG